LTAERLEFIKLTSEELTNNIAEDKQTSHLVCFNLEISYLNIRTLNTSIISALYIQLYAN